MGGLNFVLLGVRGESSQPRPRLPPGSSSCARRDFVRLAGLMTGLGLGASSAALADVRPLTRLAVLPGRGPNFTRPVEAFGSNELRATVREMFRVMYAGGGIGLAATQVGLPLSIFVVNEAGQPFHWPITERVFCNAVVVGVDPSAGYSTALEECLSLPGEQKRKILRANKIEVAWQDVDGNHHRQLFSGELARIIQHEVDHTNGIMIDFK